MLDVILIESDDEEQVEEEEVERNEEERDEDDEEIFSLLSQDQNYTHAHRVTSPIPRARTFEAQPHVAASQEAAALFTDDATAMGQASTARTTWVSRLDPDTPALLRQDTLRLDREVAKKRKAAEDMAAP
ncbi:hypothetical protein BGZ72_003416, partial [Mortierella alpina]